jgi:hypothetical protein
MTTELKQAAQQSTLCLQAVCRYISDVLAGDASSSEKHIARTIMHLLPLEQAVPIQQAEAQQPATPEPVVSRNPFASRCYTMSESHLSGHRLIVGFEKLEDAQAAHEWIARQGRGDFTHPAPSVPADVVRVPVQVLKDASEALGNFVSDHGWGDADMQAMDNLDAYIARHEANRAAMLAAK